MNEIDEALALAKCEVTPPVTSEGEIARLAALDERAYEDERSASAVLLGWRVKVLDAAVGKARTSKGKNVDSDDAVESIEAWPEPVDGASLAEEIRDLLKAHVVFGNISDADALTIWIFGTYLMESWRLFPKVLISSPTKRCGKTTLLEVLEALVFRAMMCSNMTAPTLFRSIDKWQPTLLIDEADRFLRDKDELNGIINAGHTRRMAFVNRCVEVNGEHDVKRFSVWCAQVFAGIGSQADTLVDRSLNIGLRRKLPADTVDRLPFDLHERMLRVRRQLVRWTADNTIRLAAMETEPPACGNDRLRDNYAPLWRLAALLGGVWPDRIAASYVTHVGGGDDTDEPAAIMLMRDMLDIFAGRNTDRLHTVALVVDLINLEDRPWAEWRHGRPLSPQSVANLLRPYKIRPRDVRIGVNALKGYHRAEIAVVAERYAHTGASEPRHRDSVENKEEIGVSTRDKGSDCRGSKADIPEQNQSCRGVADNSDTLDPDAWA